MSLESLREPVELAQFVVLVIFSLLGVAVAVLRLIATHGRARKAAFEDWMAAVAAFFSVMTNVVGIVATIILNGRDITVEVAESPSDYANMRKWSLAGVYFYLVHTLSVRLSVLALYHRIFKIRRDSRIWLYLLGASQTVLFIIFCVFQVLQCRPFRLYWDLSVEGACVTEGTIILGGEIPNSFVDFGMVLYAMIMIRPIQLPAGVKIRLYFLFGIGVLVGVIGFVKIAITYSTDALFSFGMFSILTSVQMFVSLLCCCLPVVYHMLPTSTSLAQLSSRILEYMSLKSHLKSKSAKEGTIQGSVPKATQHRPMVDEVNQVCSDSDISLSV